MRFTAPGQIVFKTPMGVSRTEVRNEGSDVTCLLSFFPRAALEFAG